MPAGDARLLDCQPEHGGKAVGGGTKPEGADEPKQICRAAKHGMSHVYVKGK